MTTVGKEVWKREEIWVNFDTKDPLFCEPGCPHGKNHSGCDLFGEDRKRVEGKFKRVNRCFLTFSECGSCSARLLQLRMEFEGRELKRVVEGERIKFYDGKRMLLDIHKDAEEKCTCQPWEQFPGDTPISTVRDMVGG